MKKGLNEVLTIVEEEKWRELYDNLCWTYMEAVLDQDGSIQYRIEDNLSRDEDEIVATLPLKPSYWADTLTDWGLFDEENNTVNVDAEQENIEEFINEVLKNAFVERWERDIVTELKKHRIGIRVDDIVKEVIQEQAKKENRSMSNLIESLITETYSKEIEKLRKEKSRNNK